MIVFLIVPIVAVALMLLLKHVEDEKARKERLKRIEQERIRESEQAQLAERQRELERQQRQLAHDQIELAKQQVRESIERRLEEERLRKEQEKQAEQLKQHEKRIADLEFRMSQAESDIEFLSHRIAQLDAQRDLLMLQQSGTVPGGKEHTKYQTKIISIDNQIHTAESKLTKARHIKTMAQRELSA